MSGPTSVGLTTVAAAQDSASGVCGLPSPRITKLPPDASAMRIPSQVSWYLWAAWSPAWIADPKTSGKLLVTSERVGKWHNLGPIPMVYYHLRPSSSLWVCTPFSDTGLSNLGHSSIITYHLLHRESVWLHFPYLLNHATSKLGSFFGFKFDTKQLPVTMAFSWILRHFPILKGSKRLGLPRSHQPRPSDGTAVCREAQRYHCSKPCELPRTQRLRAVLPSQGKDPLGNWSTQEEHMPHCLL